MKEIPIQLAYHQHEQRRRRWKLHPLPASAPAHVADCDVAGLAQLSTSEIRSFAGQFFALGLGVTQFGNGVGDESVFAGERWSVTASQPASRGTVRRSSQPGADRIRVSGLALLPGRSEANYLSGLAYAAGLQYGRRTAAQKRFHQTLNLEGMSIDFQGYCAGSLLIIDAAGPTYLADEVLEVISELVEGYAFHPDQKQRETMLAQALGQSFDSPVERAIEDATRLLTGQTTLAQDLDTLGLEELAEASEWLTWTSVVSY